MSLVAYESSDDSEQEFVDDSPNSKTVILPKDGVTLSTESVSDKAGKLGLFSKLPPPKRSAITDYSDGPNASKSPKIETINTLPSTLPKKGDSDTIGLLGLFSKLPAPKRSSIIEDLEGPVTSKISKKETIKIVIPSLREFDNDEEEETQKIKRKPSLEGSGLIGILPEPQHLALKETFSRKLIPHSVSRKPASTLPKQTLKPGLSKPAIIVAPPATDPLDDHNSDDENITDFFSLSKTVTLPAEIPLPDVNAKETVGAELLQTSNFNEDKTVADFEHWNQPLVNKDSSNNSFTHPLETEHVGYSGTDYSHTDYSFNASNDAVYNEQSSYGAAYDSNPSRQQTWDSQHSSSCEPDLLQDNALLRLAGRKQSNRENIQLLDVKGDDLVAGRNEWLLKNLSEETGYQSASKKSDQPSSMHRRKHQITYLAFQAKAREQELKSQWANNRMTKRQTQSKYGF